MNTALQSNPLLQEISRSAGDGLELLQPPSHGYELLINEARASIAHLRSAVGRSDQFEKKQTGLEAQIKQTQEECNRIKADHEKAFAVERPYLEKMHAEHREKVKALRAQLEAARADISSMHQIGRQLRDHSKPSMSRIIETFPDLQIIDLNCLLHFKLANGLPALGAFSLDSNWTSYCVESGSACVNRVISKNFSNECLLQEQPKELLQNLACNIQLATGAASPWPQTQREWQAAFPGVEKNKLPPASAERIRISSDFSTLNGSIPQSSRDLINRAIQSKYFSKVLLLAEVKSWEVQYLNLQGEPRIQGKVIPERKTRDPLIVGVSKIGKTTFNFLLGAFDTTPLEKLIQDEFSVKP